MTIGVSLAIKFGAGLYVEADNAASTGPVVLKLRFEAPWGSEYIAVAHKASWNLISEHAQQYTASWSIHFAHNAQFPYGLRLERDIHYPYGDMRQYRQKVVATYSDLGSCRKAMRAAYWLTQQVVASSSLSYDVADTDPVARRLAASWAILDEVRLQSIANTPELVWQGRRIRIIEATLSCDEDSPVWIARIEIADLADFAAISIGDTLTLTLGLETFVLVVDGKMLSRVSVADQRKDVTAVSPVALLDAPFAGTISYYESNAISARSAVESLIGHVEWNLQDWIIPAGRLMLSGTTPLAAARNIVAAIGGLIESNPDGSVVCRKRHPVSIPQYESVTVAHSLFDSDVLSAQTQIAPMRGYNRVTIANDDSGSTVPQDTVEYVRDETDPFRGIVRAYLASQRPVMLVHTGNPATVIASLGPITRTETEVVEFIDGRASTRYPVDAIVNTSWQHTDLGDVSASGKTLTSATQGYSLLRITYTTTSLNWRVALSIDEEVQFVLVDA